MAYAHLVFARVRRLFFGEVHNRFHNKDITEIYLYLRSMARDRQTIKEIGDLIAHKVDRDKGFLTRHVQDTYDTIVCAEWKERWNDRPPPRAPEGFRAIFNRLDNAIIRKALGKTRAQAQPILNELCRKFSELYSDQLHLEYADGHITLTQEEGKLLHMLQGHMAITDALAGRQIVADYEAAISRVFEKADLPPLPPKSAAFLQLCVLAEMHGVEISLAGSKLAYLQVGEDDGALVCYLKFLLPDYDDITLATVLLRTDLRAEDHRPEQGFIEMNLVNPLEVTNDLKFRYVT